MKNPKDRFFVIVPEQFSMQAQKELVRLHPRHGLLNIDVLSFNRLAHRVFDEVGVKQAELLEEIGKSFVLQKIALDTTDRILKAGVHVAAGQQPDKAGKYSRDEVGHL